MKYLLTIFFLSVFLSHVSAQEKHFVFMQSDAKQPFYASVNGKLFSSSASGYLIIPKLADGSYNVTVGFAQNAYPEQTFNLSIQNKDLGFDLKNFNEKGWGLFNLQSLDITMASAGNSNTVAKALSAGSRPDPTVISFDKKKDPAQLTAATAKDTSAITATGTEEVKGTIATAQPSPVLNSGTASATQNAATTNQPVKVAEAEHKVSQTGDVKKVSEVTGEEGVHIAYVEGSGQTKDTINIIIPSAPASGNSSVSGSAKSLGVNSETKTSQARSAPPSAVGQDDLKFLDVKMKPKEDKVEGALTPTDNRRVFENSNCKNIASDDDYAKLRKKMAMETTDDRMISEAKKFYRNKCFTTSQIKGLSTLFLSDEGRFKFFDASFVSVADASQYSSLQTEFIDPTFVNRFKSLIQ